MRHSNFVKRDVDKSLNFLSEIVISSKKISSTIVFGLIIFQVLTIMVVGSNISEESALSTDDSVLYSSSQSQQGLIYDGGVVNGFSPTELQSHLNELNSFTLDLLGGTISTHIFPETSLNEDECSMRGAPGTNQTKDPNVKMYLFSSNDTDTHGFAYIWNDGAILDRIFIQFYGERINSITHKTEGWRLIIKNYAATSQPPTNSWVPSDVNLGVNSQIDGGQNLNLFPSVPNAVGNSQFEFKLVRFESLYDGADPDYICRNILHSELLFRTQAGVQWMLESFRQIDTNDPDEDANTTTSFLSPGTDCDIHSNLLLYQIQKYRSDAYTRWNQAPFALRGNTNSWHHVEIDSIFYFGSSLDQHINWSTATTGNSQLWGCTLTPNLNNGGIGFGYIYLDENEPFQWNSVALTTHELGHAIGGSHNPSNPNSYSAVLGTVNGYDPNVDNRCATSPNLNQNAPSYLSIMVSGNKAAGEFDQECYGVVPYFSQLSISNFDSVRNSIPFQHFQPDWSENNRIRSSFRMNMWFLQPFNPELDESSSDLIEGDQNNQWTIGGGDPFWRAEWNITYIGSGTIDIYEWFVVIRSDWNGTPNHRDAWLGYAGERFSIPQPLFGNSTLQFENGYSSIYYPLSQDVNGSFWDCSSIPAGHSSPICWSEHDSSDGLTGQGPFVWVLWPTYHIFNAYTPGGYGPFYWNTLSWEQNN